jgi:hypothetical protein
MSIEMDGIALSIDAARDGLDLVCYSTPRSS